MRRWAAASLVLAYEVYDDLDFREIRARVVLGLLLSAFECGWARMGVMVFPSCVWYGWE